MTPELCEVVITAPDPDWLAAFSRGLVTDGLCAAAHNLAPIRSLYRWKGEIHDRQEGRVVLHTRTRLVPRIVDRTVHAHPYEVPAVAATPLIAGNPDYLQWVLDETGAR